MNNNKGFSLVEIIIASGIVAGILLVVSEFMLKSAKQYSEFEGKMLITTDVNQAMHNLSIDLSNLSRLTDNGVEVESFNVNDRSYLGIYGLSQADSAKLPGCLYQEANNDSGYSVIRFTTISQLRPAKLIKFWKEDASPLQDLIISRTEDLNNQIFNELVNNGVSPIKEIVILDGDGFTSSRLLVLQAEYVESFIDPYDNIEKSPEEFKYYRLVVSKPKTFYKASQAPLPHQFITGSYVVAVATKIICVSLDKTQLLQIDELSGTTRVLLNTKSEKATIQSFRVNYLSSTDLEVNPYGVSVFPSAEIANPPLSRRCIDQLLVTMDLSKGQKVLTYTENVHIANYNSKRPSICN